MKFPLTIFLLSTLFSSLTQANESCNERFSIKQLWVMQEAFEGGIDEDYSFTLAAVTWQESSAGLKLHRKDGEHWSLNSYGAFHILLRTAKARLGGCKTYQCSRIAKRLKEDIAFSIGLAIEELDYWENRLKSRKSAISAYNAGNNWNSTIGRGYFNKIHSKKLYLKRCIRF